MSTGNASKEIDSLDSLISLLQHVATDVKSATASNPKSIDKVLQQAKITTSQAISQNLPKEQSDQWLSELSSLLDGSEKSPCSCAALRTEQHKTSTMNETDGNEITIDVSSADDKVVTCIHGCGLLFCSARCRRKQIRQHATTCTMLKKKKVLKKIGISPDHELF